MSPHDEGLVAVYRLATSEACRVADHRRARKAISDNSWAAIELKLWRKPICLIAQIAGRDSESEVFRFNGLPRARVDIGVEACVGERVRPIGMVRSLRLVARSEVGRSAEN